MREEHKLNKAIEQNGIDTQSEILEELKRRYPQYVEHSDKKQAPVKKRKLAFISAIAAAAVCVAVIVPCAVLLPNRDNGADNGGKENVRYCTQNEYHKEDVEYTIGDYYKNNNSIFLYFDWYSSGEECETVCYMSNADNEVLCLEEKVYLPEEDELVQLSITKSNVILDVFDLIIKRCKNEDSVDNHTVKWSVNNVAATCIFEDNGFRYFIQIQEEQNENKLFELVTKLLETK